jgi:3-phenylpropionate/trans-cinnamate dioxygenase ferredoxin reductase subunit
MAGFELVIVGGGLATPRAIASYREAGGGGTIALFSKDTDPPYHRPPLSKRYLRGEAEREDVLVEPESFYREPGVEVFLETAVASVSPGEHEVELEDGTRHRYRRLLLATGAWPRTLAVAGNDLEGVRTLRTVVDSTRIRESAGAATAAVVVGAGFIGMEVAASLRSLGLDVTLVHRGDALFELL